MNRWILISFISFAFSASLFASEPQYHKVLAQKGDGVFALLRRYDLADEKCNVLQFYKLNQMNENDILLAGQKYFIPILVYNYNGQSIRSTIGNNDWDTAIKIQEYNERLFQNKLRNSTYRESKILWVPFSILYCNTSNTNPTNVSENSNAVLVSNTHEINTNPATAEPENTAPAKIYRTERIFGKNFEKLEVVDQSLKNKVFFIMSGHGGPDPGAVCTTCPQQLCEDEYAYDVALRLSRNLMQHGANVEIIIQDADDGIRKEQFLKCDVDEKCLGESKIPLNQKQRLAQRTNAINMLHKKYNAKGLTDQVVIVIHVDSRSTNKRQDVFFYHHEKSKKGELIANNIQNTFKEKYDRFQKSRGYHGSVTSRNLYVINNTIPPLVFIELANIKNPQDQKRLILDTNRQALANWIFEGLLK